MAKAQTGRRCLVPGAVCLVGIWLAACGLTQTRDPNVLMSQAETHKAEGNWSACISDYTGVLSSQPALVKAYAGRAACSLAAGNAPGAVQDYTKAINLSDRDPSLYLNRAGAFEHLGNNTQAAADYTKAGELGTTNPNWTVQAAEGLRGMGFYSDAHAVVQRGIAQFPNYWAIFMEAADVELALGNDQAALRYFESALKLATSGDSSQVLTDRGKYFLRRLQYQLALSDFNQAVDRDPQNWSAYDGRSQARLGVGQTSGALTDLGSAIAIYQGLHSSNTWPLASLFEERGKLELRLSRKDAAISDFKAALDILTAAGPADWRGRLGQEISAAQG